MFDHLIQYLDGSLFPSIRIMASAVPHVLTQQTGSTPVAGQFLVMLGPF